MKRLSILRHAKSSWAQPGLPDESRPLNKRGKKQLERLSDWLADHPLNAQIALCSAAQRTRETWEGIEQALPDTPVEFLSELYDGMIDDYLTALYERQEDNILLIGHNPTCDEVARALSAPSSPQIDRLMAQHFSTGTLAVIEFEITEWTQMRDGSGRLVTLLRPRDLERAS